MSTRSYICKENKDGTYTGIYCHSDGYLTYNGAMLLDHYNEREKVEKLIGLGDLSVLYPNIDPDPSRPHSFDERQNDVCVFYGRDRGETDTEAKEVDLKNLDEDIWIEYCYVYGKDDVWRYFENGHLKEGLKSVQEGLDKEYQMMGFKRPENCYGFFTEEDIKSLRSAEQSEM